MLAVARMVRVAAFCLGSVAACIVGASCAAKRPPSCAANHPPSADPNPWTLDTPTGFAEYRGRCPRCDALVKGSAGWAHGVDAAGRPMNWHGYMSTCPKCGADLFAEMDDVETEGGIIKWRLGEDVPVIANTPADDSTP